MMFLAHNFLEIVLAGNDSQLEVQKLYQNSLQGLQIRYYSTQKAILIHGILNTSLMMKNM